MQKKIDELEKSRTNTTYTPLEGEAVSERTRKSKRIPLAVKRLVWNKYIGEDIGKAKCYCCNLTDIMQISFHCGHVVARVYGGETVIDNLRPICQNCNCSMSTTNMMDFIKSYGLDRLTPRSPVDRVSDLGPSPKN